MSLLESFLGNAAGAGASILGEQAKQQAAEEQAQRMAKFQEQLTIDRLKTIAELKRSMDLQAGKEISTEADKIGKERIDKKVKSTMEADPELNGMQPGDQEALDKATPSQLKDIGLMETMSTTQKLGDSANAALKLGYNDQAKEIRGHQQVEMQSERDARREEHDIKREDLADMRYQTDVEWRKERAVVEDRLATVRERLAGAAEARAGRAEKNQTTAMEKAELNSSRQSLQAILKDVALQEEKINSQMASIQSKMADPMLSPDQKKPFEDQLKSLEKRSNGLDAQRVSVRDNLRELNGMESYKAEKEAPAKKEYPTPNEAQLKFLMANPGNVKEFESKFGNGAIPMEFYQQNKGDGKQSVKAEELTKANTNILSSAGKTMLGESRYNVELPGGTTKMMSKSELERLGYKFSN